MANASNIPNKTNVVTVVSELTKNIELAKRRSLEKLGERGFELLRAEVPKRTRKLEEGVQKPVFDFDNFSATIKVSVKPKTNEARSGKIYGSDGSVKKTITLNGSKPFDYALAVVSGRSARIAPKGRVFLIEVSNVPEGESYLEAGGLYIFRTRTRSVAPNPFDERAANRLSGESENIVGSVIKQLFE